MRNLLRITAGLALSIAAFGQQPAMRADTNPAAESEVKALQLKLADLIVHADWDEYAKHLAPDYLHTSYSGRVEGKDEALATLRDPQRKIIVMELEPQDQRVRIYGDAGVSSAEFTISVRESGQIRSRRIRLTSVFVKRDGQWYQVAEQATTIGK